MFFLQKHGWIFSLEPLNHKFGNSGCDPADYSRLGDDTNFMKVIQ